jgi:hypothetical protein
MDKTILTEQNPPSPTARPNVISDMQVQLSKRLLVCNDEILQHAASLFVAALSVDASEKTYRYEPIQQYPRYGRHSW